VAIGPEDDRHIVQLLVEQVEFADVIVLNKCAEVSEADRLAIKGILHKLNPQALLVPTNRSRVSLDTVLNTGRFSLEQASRAPGWLRALRGTETSESAEYGISSFVFRARVPFHPQRLYQFVRTMAPAYNLLRSKGFAWLASRHNWVALWSQAGRLFQLQPTATWWAAVAPAEWPTDPESRATILGHWEGDYGDRRQELVFIGQNLSVERVRGALAACLLTPTELLAGPTAWQALPDPWPTWQAEPEPTEPNATH
jgi:G3E family GTPase